jgi:hypothetical protein
LEVLVASLAESPSSAAQQITTAPTLSTDRLTPGTTAAPPSGAPSSSGSFPNDDYRGWASL